MALNQWRVDEKHEIFDLTSPESQQALQFIQKTIKAKLSYKHGPIIRPVSYDYWKVMRELKRSGKQLRRRSEKTKGRTVKEEIVATRKIKVQEQQALRREERKKAREETQAAAREEAKTKAAELFNEKYKKPLYNFLMENTTYEQGAVTYITDVRNRFNATLEKDVRCLDNETFKEVNKEYTIEIKKVCKHCDKEAKKGCCDKYNTKDRTRRTIIKNMKLSSEKNTTNIFGSIQSKG